jgi:hypothetical protein
MPYYQYFGSGWDRDSILIHPDLDKITLKGYVLSRYRKFTACEEQNVLMYLEVFIELKKSTKEKIYGNLC